MSSRKMTCGVMLTTTLHEVGSADRVNSNVTATTPTVKQGMLALRRRCKMAE